MKGINILLCVVLGFCIGVISMQHRCDDITAVSDRVVAVADSIIINERVMDDPDSLEAEYINNRQAYDAEKKKLK